MPPRSWRACGSPFGPTSPRARPRCRARDVLPPAQRQSGRAPRHRAHRCGRRRLGGDLAVQRGPSESAAGSPAPRPSSFPPRSGCPWGWPPAPTPSRPCGSRADRPSSLSPTGWSNVGARASTWDSNGWSGPRAGPIPTVDGLLSRLLDTVGPHGSDDDVAVLAFRWTSPADAAAARGGTSRSGQLNELSPAAAVELDPAQGVQWLARTLIHQVSWLDTARIVARDGRCERDGAGRAAMPTADRPQVEVSLSLEDPSAPVICLAGDSIWRVWRRRNRVWNRTWPPGPNGSRSILRSSHSWTVQESPFWSRWQTTSER